MTPPRKILIVDDQPEILELASTVLSGAGFSVATVRSGVEALERLGQEAVDLLLLDINMPAMDGWETLRLIRADDTLDDLPVVMFSVKADIADKVHSLQEGASAYVTKPFVIDELVRRVQEVLDQASGPGPSNAGEA